MLFLATPHRGSANAEFLNNVLRTTPGLSSKTYVSELEKTSTSIQDINEQFRTVCGNIMLVSFYENQKTTIAFGVRKMVRDPFKTVTTLILLWRLLIESLLFLATRLKRLMVSMPIIMGYASSVIQATQITCK